jgi:hypothetical protein
MTQRLRQLPLPLRILAYAVAAALMLAVAAGVGTVAALVSGSGLGSLGGSAPQQAGGAKSAPASEQEDVSKEDTSKEDTSKEGTSKEGTSKEGTSGPLNEVQYLDKVADIQNGSVEASLDSNDKLLRYDSLTDEDIEDMKANNAALEDYSDRIEDLDPPEEYEDQYKALVLAIDELRDANELAYRLVTDPASITGADLETYDGRVDRATAYLQRSNEILGKDYKTAETAREISYG